MSYNLENIYKQLDDKEKIITCFFASKYHSLWTKWWEGWFILGILFPPLLILWILSPELRKLIVITKTNIHFFKFDKKKARKMFGKGTFVYSHSIQNNNVKSIYFMDNLYSKKKYYLHIHTNFEKTIYNGIQEKSPNSNNLIVDEKTKELIIKNFNSDI